MPNHIHRVLKDIIIRHTHDLIALSKEPVVTLMIPCDRGIASMRSAVNFNDEPVRRRTEIHNERPDRELPSEPHAVDLLIPKTVPKHDLRMRHVLAEIAGSICFSSKAAVRDAVAARPSPQPPPTGRGSSCARFILHP